MISLQEAATHFEAVKWTTDEGFDCRCSVHKPDNHPSAHVKMGNKGLIGRCKSCGATGKELFPAAGIKMSEVFFDNADRASPGEQYIRKKYNRHTLYDYYSFIDNSYDHTKIRYYPEWANGDKKFVNGYWENNGRFNDRKGCLNDRKPQTAIFGNVTFIKQCIAKKEMVYYCEGEKDVQMMQKLGYPAFTQGSCTTFYPELAPYLKGIRLIILADNDSGGQNGAKKLRELILPYAESVRLVTPCTNFDKADITDYFKNHDKSDFEKLIQSATTDNVSNPAPVNSVPKGTPLIKKLVALGAAKRFATNDKGSAELFSTVFKNVSRYNPTQKDWMFYNGVKWIADTEGMKAKRNAKKLADAILSYAVSVSELDEKSRENYLKYASRLMNYRDRNTMVNDAKDLNFFENTELDKDDLILNLKNCVLDLSGDTPRILEHNADLLLSKCCNASYDPNATCKLWEKTINEIMEGNAEKIRYLQKILGLCLTGITAEEELYFFYGASTRNGKSTICETVLSILNDYGATISPETLAVKANKDSRTASPDIAKLAGTRLVIASEPPKKMIFDTSLVKTMTGRDRITARFLHQNEFCFTPKFKLIINTNYLPTITDQTVFKSGRIRVVSFNKHFDEHEQNKMLKDELRKESDGILNWMIAGLYLYRKEGLEPPVAVRNSTDEYEIDSDKIGRFISECLVKSDKNTSAKDVYETYSKWCSDSGLGIDGRNNFYIELKTRGLFGASGTVNGKTVRNIVRGYVLADEEFMSVDENEPLPFD